MYRPSEKIISKCGRGEPWHSAAMVIQEILRIVPTTM